MVVKTFRPKGQGLEQRWHIPFVRITDYVDYWITQNSVETIRKINQS